MDANVIGLNIFDNTDKLFFTLAVIVTATFLISQLLARLGKPIVMAGILAGLIIKNLPIPPVFFDAKTCNTVGMLGIVLFMMLVGSQLNYQPLIKRKVNILISTIPIILPFIIGFFCSIYVIHLHLVTDLNNKYLLLFNIFFALAMSMTAFPLVSMFLAHNNLINQKVAHLALICASISEVIFWVVLGCVLLYFQHSAVLTTFRPFDIVFYLLFVFGVAPRLINFIAAKITTLRSMLGFVLVGCLFSAALADLVNLHQIFGGFIFGVLLPRNNELIKDINNRLSDLVNSLLLPAYFFETGVNADLSFIFNTTTFFLIISITVIATLSKFASAILTGKLMGLSLQKSTLLGSLLNMRGIFEIMLLNVGLNVGIINNQIYTILIIMTLLTTASSTALSPWFNKFIKSKKPG